MRCGYEGLGKFTVTALLIVRRAGWAVARKGILNLMNADIGSRVDSSE